MQRLGSEHYESLSRAVRQSRNQPVLTHGSAPETDLAVLKVRWRCE